MKRKLNSTERIINTFEGKEIDRLPIFDIIHNVELIEHITGKKITPLNAEDVTCEAVRNTLDMVRHFAIPDNLEERVITDKDGFIYKVEWWTVALMKRPIKNVEDARELMKKDIEKIYKCIDEKKICPQVTKNYCQDLIEDCDTPEEVLAKYERISNKLEDTIMIAPGSLTGIYVALHRYGFELYTYLSYDYPELVLKYMDALCDYEIFKIESFAPSKISPIAFASGVVAFNDNLIFPPNFNDKFLYPRLEKVIKTWKSYGYSVMFFADGYKWPMIDKVLSFGADSINPCEPKSHMEVKKFREKYPEIVIGSMIDCQNLLPFGTPEDVRKATIKAIEDSGGSKTLIGSTSEIHPKVPLKNSIALYETANNYVI